MQAHDICGLYSLRSNKKCSEYCRCNSLHFLLHFTLNFSNFLLQVKTFHIVDRNFVKFFFFLIKVWGIRYWSVPKPGLDTGETIETCSWHCGGGLKFQTSSWRNPGVFPWKQSNNQLSTFGGNHLNGSLKIHS